MILFSKGLTIGQQWWGMKRHFPNFRYRRRKNIPTWFGTLQPSEESPLYTIKVIYRKPKSPQVWVITPSVSEQTPHRYADKSLCLYFPKDGSWTPHEFISQTIVPWTSLWLYCYELWCATGTWYGPEAPHTGKKEV